jgi:hypothetical protein
MIRVPPATRFLAALLLLASAADLEGQTVAFHGQLSSWLIVNDVEPGAPALGLRYLPTLTVEKTWPSDRTFDVELSLNGYASARAVDGRDLEGSSDVRPYRLWARYKTPRFDARVGLQRINFGSATLLRPLMWFDTVDPRDPLQITDGVYAVLLRSYLSRDGSVWLWGLFGNESLKGFEISPTVRHRPEFGGRLQVPVPRGALAFTTHHRQADFSRGLLASLALDDPSVREGRYAADGKWDLGIGVWFEGALTHQSHSGLERPDQRALNVGADYTFGVGNGLHVLGEVLLLEQSRGAFGPGDGTTLTAASLRYPLGLLDSLSGIVYVDARGDDVYRFVSWQRTYDRWQFYVMGFWNPRLAAGWPGQPARDFGQIPLAGRGLQIMAVFNH